MASYRLDAALSLPHAPLRPLQRATWLALCLCLVGAIAAADYATGYEISLSVLFLVPVFLGVWTLGCAGGVAMAVLSAAAWFFVFVELHPHPSRFYHLLDAVLRAATWIIFALVIHRLKRALAHADERFVTVLEGLQAAVCVSDVDSGELLYVNESFRTAFGPRAPPQFASGDEGEFVHPASGRCYLARARAIRWIDGRMVRLHTATDITERKQAEETSRQQQEKLQLTSRLISVGEMASTLAHEINQPLAAIANYNMGCVRRLRSGDWDADALVNAMEKSGAEAERAGKIIRRVRELVRKRDPRRTECNVNDVVADIASLIELDAQNHDVGLSLELAPALPPVLGDKTMLEQAVLNLVRNAIEAMQDTPPGQRRLIIASRRGDNVTVEITVRDSGCGIPPALADNLFTPFFTTKPDGMGMGLNICRSIAEIHDGRLRAEHNQDGGSTFRLSLPAVTA